MTKSVKAALFGIVFAILAVFVLKGGALLIPSGTWISQTNLSSARNGASAALLNDGRVLITGGESSSGPVATADFFAPDGTVSTAPPMINARSKHVSVALQNGRILVAGGVTANGSATSTAEIFDPAAGIWTNVGTGMTEARSGATAAVLQDGRVLVAGGQNGSAISSTLEIFDPASGTFTPAGMMGSPRTQHAMTVLQDGRVLIVGGNSGSNGTPPAPTPVASTDIFDPVAGTVTAGPSLAVARFGHSTTTLLNGQVVIIGGNNGNANPAQMDTTPAELIDFTDVTPTFTALATNLATPREGHLAILLANNNSVLIAGGSSAGATIASAELFTAQGTPPNTWTYNFRSTGSLNAARSSASGAANQINTTSAVMARNGVVMVAGGADASGNALNSTEAYGYATVQTDQSDYAPGQTVTITGSGWVPGETVSLSFLEAPYYDTHPTLTAVADANGNIINTDFAPDIHDLNIRFYLTATGSQSQAQNTFTDAITLTSVTVGGQSGAVTAGTAGAITYPICVSYNGSNSTISFSVISGLPSGVSAGFSANAIPTPAKCPTTATTLTLTTTAAVPAGSYTFTVQATGGGTVTTTGTLVVSGPVSAGTSTLSASPASVAADGSTTSTVTATLKDSGGNPVSGKTVTLTAGSGTSTISAASGPSNSSGIVTFTVKDTVIESVTYTAKDSSDNITVAQTAAVSFIAGAVSASTSMVTSSPASVPADGATTSTITVTLLDAGSHPVSGKTVTLAGSGSSTISAASGPSNSNGIVTFTVKDTVVQNVTYTAKDTTDNITITDTAAVSFTGVGTTTTVSSSSNPSPYGGSVTFTAQIAPGSGSTAPTGTVQFVVDSVNFGSAVTVSSCAPSPDACATSIATTTLAAGTHTVTANYTATGSFSGSSGTLSGGQMVNPAALTITPSAQNKNYGQTVSFGSGSTLFTSSGLQNSQTIGSVTLAVNNNGGAATAAAGSYTITPSAATGGTFTASNYTITYATGTLTVNAAQLDITANNDSKTYGQARTYGSGSAAFTTGLNQLVNGDTVTSVTITDTNSGGLAAAAAGGTYHLTPGAAVFGSGLASNYIINYHAGTLTVNAAQLDITANNDSKNYGQTRTYGSGSTAFTTGLNQLVNGDTVTSVTITDTNSGGLAAAAAGGDV